MANFFIDRPVFAWVVSIIIMIAGVIGLNILPVSQYPDIAPTTIAINAAYPGASAEAVEDSVTQVIEQQLTGLDGLEYITATSSSSGVASITLTFTAGTDPDIAQVQVQNKLARASPLLPEPVQRQGVSVSKSSGGFLMIVGLMSPTGEYDQTDLGDFVRTNIYDDIARIDGVGNVQLFGSQYAMRVWLDPASLSKFQLMPSDVIAAIRAQNAQVSSGALGGAPSIEEQAITATITLQSLMSTPEQFENILVRSSVDGGTVRLSDVARVEMGAQDYAFVARFNGAPASGFAVNLAAGANALDTAEAVKARVTELAKNFPAGIEVVFPYDATPFVKESIHEVEKTLFEAIILVLLVILVFLQSIRATFIPMIAVPIVILGTFAILAMTGYSINMLTMFALVLAIGLLVDDAIVVVENVERVMEEDGLSPKEATRKSMKQITGALVGIAVVLSAVYVPMAFFPGSVGVIYRQFSVTIVSAMFLSVVVAIVLAPALCATLLKNKHGEAKSPIDKMGQTFNRSFKSLENGYTSIVERIIRRRWIFMGVFALAVVAVCYSFQRLPTSFLPNEDQGSLITMAQLPADASLARTAEVMDGVQKYYRFNEADNMKGIFTLAGFNFAGNSQNLGISFLSLKDWSERPGQENSSFAIAGRAMQNFSGNLEARVFAITPPPIRELGNSSGFNMYLVDRGGIGRSDLGRAQNELLGLSARDDVLANVRPNGLPDSPQFNVNIDYEKANALGVRLSDVTSLLSVTFGGVYVNDFLDRGRIKRVYVQGDAQYRMMPNDFGNWRVRNSSGEMTPIDEIITTEWSYGPPQLRRFNGQAALNIQGQAAPGQSSGDAMLRIEDIVGGLPFDVGVEWAGLSLQERQSGSQANMLYILSVLFIFLCLAALYESWTVPISVLLVAPLGLAGAIAAAYFRGMSNDVFFQVGVLTTVGLASKNAILIIEFAKSLEEQGKELVEATLQAVRMRFRPILMTSFAFGFGVIPLALSTGAGAGARVAIGTAVLGGVIASTVLGVFFAPLFYVVVRKLTGGKSLKQPIAQVNQQEFAE